MNCHHLLQTRSLLIAASVCLPVAALAQTADETTTILERIVITSTSGERSLKDAPASVTVVVDFC